MKLVDAQDKNKFIAQINEAVDATLAKDEASQVRRFVEQLFVGVFLEEFQGRRVSDVLGSIMSCWKFINQFAGAGAKIEVFNPNLEEFGWQSTHTVLVVLQKNMPFIIDSVRMELNAREINIHSIHHANLLVERDGSGRLLGIVPQSDWSKAPKARPERETMLFVEVDHHGDQSALVSLRNSIKSVLGDVSIAVADYPEMMSLAKKIAKTLSEGDNQFFSQEEQLEGAQFLDWIVADRFTFLGYVEYQLEAHGEQQLLVQVKGSELGILKHRMQKFPDINLGVISSKAKKYILGKQLFTFAKSSHRSRVHRPVYPDYISVKSFDQQGNVNGERRFLGLYTAKAYSESPSDIPFLRQKAKQVIAQSGLDANDYSGKELLQLLAVYPRNELFQIDPDELLRVLTGTLYIQERRKIRCFMREDAFGRFVTCLVYVPRDIYNTDLRLKIQQILLDYLQGSGMDFDTYISESGLTRAQFIIKVDPLENRQLNVAEIEEKIIAVAQSWQDELEISLFETYGEGLANRYLNTYRNAFSSSYREEFSPRRAAIDIEHIEAVSAGRPLSMSFYRALDEEDRVFHFKLFCAGEQIPLSDVMPIFENMGFRVIGEHPYETVDRENNAVWLHDFMLTTTKQQAIDIHQIRPNFEQLFIKVWHGEAENDSFNRLVIEAYMSWREIAMLRSYARYMRQIRVSNSQEFISNTIVDNVDIARLLVQIFECRFNPKLNKSQAKSLSRQEQYASEFATAIERVQNLTEDKILRLYLDLINATVRTNFYQPDEQGQDKNYISLKLKPRLIAIIPPPVPMFEIFVYSPRIEGVHLRGGKVARGGIRWSDRYEDYRTEVLGLVKAQQVKNSVIVPVGAKGGFVAKMLPVNDRDAYLKEGIACYQTFITGLLDVTDNLLDGKVVPPAQVVRYDEDDYYLVVAADKGTATFSDIANEISLTKGHWLGDAFASGGSLGYDHKKMGITARGAWISVERHFRELEHNSRTTPFTVIGIGDMAGDVFGNGLLMSQCAKLVAAFNHMHIFFDPDPDPQLSFAERKRLFELPRSTWEDYSAPLISKGGGVFSRSAKSIPLSPEMRQLLGVSETKMPPNQLINSLLKMSADLLWVGGIGTYVKASSESHAEVGDKANDALRVNGNELSVKIVAEGGNLGITQLGRIEYGRKGGRLNTDFIDNSAGVDCSDHEVNIKILLNELQLNGDLTHKQRNKLLAEMTDSVAQLVLKNNYRQTQAISIAHGDGLVRMEEYRRLISALESAGKLKRAIEFIPDDEAITERKSLGEGLSRPELSVLISYVKGDLKELLNASSLPDDESLLTVLDVAFPEVLVKKFGPALHKHRLRREIIATQIANDMVNHMGITFVERLKQSTGAGPAAVALAYIVARQVFRLEYWWQAIEALDYQVPSALQMNMMGELMRLMRRACRWLIRNRRSELNVASNMGDFERGISQISQALPNYLNGGPKEFWQAKYDGLVKQGVPLDTAAMVAGASHLYAALGIIEAQESTGESLDLVANAYYALGSRLELTWFGSAINNLTPQTHWQALAREAFREDLDWQQRALTVGLLKLADAPKDIEARIDFWVEQHQELVDRWRHTLTEFKATAEAELSMYSVALRELLDLAQSTVHAVPG